MDALTVEDDDGRGAGTLASERCFNTGLIGLHTMIITMMSRGRGFRLLRAARFNSRGFGGFFNSHIITIDSQHSEIKFFLQ